MEQALTLSWAAAFQYLVAIAVLEGAIVFGAIPAIRALFALVLESSGRQNLTDRNLLSVLSDPVSFLALLAIAIIALAAVSMQLATIIVMANRQQTGLPASARAIATDVWRVIRSIGHYQSPLLFAYFFLLAPLGGFGVLSVVTRGIGIPPFVTREFMKTVAGGAGYLLVIALAMYVNLRLILTLPGIVVSRRTTLHAMWHSLVGTSRQSGRIAVLVGAVILSAVVVMTALTEALVGISALADGASDTTSLAVASLCIGAGQVAAFLVVGATTVIISHILVAVTRQHLGYPFSPRAVEPVRRSLAKPARVAVRMTAVAMAVVLSFTTAPAMAASSSGAGDALVIAHRGAVGGGVENTIGALEAAVRQHADLVETDMQETKDGYFVASHDSNLLMVAGRNLNIYDLTLAEATAITEREGGFTGTIPSMTDYVRRAEQLGVKLLIELKVTGHETPDYVDRFLAELDSLGLTDDNSYHSLDPDTVRQLKAKRPELSVGLTIAMSVGAIPDVGCDFLVIEQASYTPELLAEAHAQHKPVYVWTVNDETTMRDLFRSHVDGIVTDLPTVARSERAEVVGEQGRSHRVRDALDYLTVL